MKKTILAAAALLVFLSAQLLYWGKSPGSESEAMEARYIFLAPVGNSQDANQSQFRNLIAEGIYQGDEEFHTDTQLIACSDNDTIAEYIRRGIYSDVDGIIISGYRDTDAEELLLAVEEAREQGIPVVLLDHRISGLAYDCFIGIDNEQAGILAADMLAELTSGADEADWQTELTSGTDAAEPQAETADSGIHAAVVLNDLTSENVAVRAESFQAEWKALTGTTDVPVAEALDSYLTLKAAMTELFEQDPELAAVFCADGISSTYMKDLLNGLGIEDVTVVGFDQLPDILQAVEDGTYACAIGQDTVDMGYQAVKYLAENPQVKGEEEEPEEMQVSVFLIDQSNAAEYSSEEMEEQSWLID